MEKLIEELKTALAEPAAELPLLCGRIGQEKTEAFSARLPLLRSYLQDDIRAALEGDPAAVNGEEVAACYPGFYAVTVYRLAHELLLLGVPLLPRMLTEQAHSHTGIDIHPGAQIGRSFFIDHGTGVVIGQTAVIGDRVRLYHGVTLGTRSARDAAGLRDVKRHPTVEDDVIIYANATILGGDTVIGRGSIIGAGVLLTHSIPPNTKVTADPILRMC